MPPYLSVIINRSRSVRSLLFWIHIIEHSILSPFPPFLPPSFAYFFLSRFFFCMFCCFFFLDCYFCTLLFYPTVLYFAFFITSINQIEFLYFVFFNYMYLSNCIFVLAFFITCINQIEFLYFVIY